MKKLLIFIFICLETALNNRVLLKCTIYRSLKINKIFLDIFLKKSSLRKQTPCFTFSLDLPWSKARKKGEPER